MLARGNRLTRGTDYRAVVRGGGKCAARNTVTYVSSTRSSQPARFGFIVSKQVGGAVIRNTVRRRLKAVCAEALPGVSAGSDVVVRALPGAATADFETLRAEVSRCLSRRAAT
ncbi:ribonuclease P protein component [Microbacterium sp.]|uniref:ribonuclease P protein component n=1 Tax=Microbacterium sp. TaxID=51671 RepID=UPI003A87FBB3